MYQPYRTLEEKTCEMSYRDAPDLTCRPISGWIPVPESAANRDGPRTRQAGDESNFKLPVARLEIRKNSFAVITVQQWNQLPPEIKKRPKIAKLLKEN
jgi:hypothetical protein